MSENTLGSLVEESRIEERALLIELSEMSDSQLSYALEREQVMYDSLCSDYCTAGETYQPAEPRRLWMMQKCVMMRLR